MKFLKIVFLLISLSCTKEDDPNSTNVGETNEVHFNFKYNGIQFETSHEDGILEEVIVQYRTEENGIFIAGRRIIDNPNFEEGTFSIFIYNPVKDSTYDLVINDPRIDPYPDQSYAFFGQKIPTDTVILNGREQYYKMTCYHFIDEKSKAEVKITDFSEHPDVKGVYAIKGEFEMTLVRTECDTLDPYTMYPQSMKITDGSFFRGGFGAF